jgi:two-component system, NarL family, nitrate/nitrite response regulator NarL
MRVVICDDHQLLVEALATALADLGYTIEAAVTTPGEGVRAVNEYDPDVLLLDVNFPVGSGLDAARQVTARHPRTKVVMLTGTEDHDVLGEALDAGVSGYVRKAQRIEVIAQAIEDAVAGKLAVDKALAQRLRDRGHATTAPKSVVAALTPRERHVLKMLVRGSSTADIVHELGVSPSTVRTHVQSIFVKLGVHSRVQAVTMLSHLGLLDPVDGISVGLD